MDSKEELCMLAKIKTNKSKITNLGSIMLGLEHYGGVTELLDQVVLSLPVLWAYLASTSDDRRGNGGEWTRVGLGEASRMTLSLAQVVDGGV